MNALSMKINLHIPDFYTARCTAPLECIITIVCEGFQTRIVICMRSTVRFFRAVVLQLAVVFAAVLTVGLIRAVVVILIFFTRNLDQELTGPFFEVHIQSAQINRHVNPAQSFIYIGILQLCARRMYAPEEAVRRKTLGRVFLQCHEVFASVLSAL